MLQFPGVEVKCLLKIIWFSID